MTRMIRHASRCLLVVVATAFPAVTASSATNGGYAVLVSKTTHEQPAWRKVVDCLARKHKADIVVYEKSVEQSLHSLRKKFPRYVCFVATPEETTRSFVARVHRLTRRLDDDPYTDSLWGIVTGYDAACALRIAKLTEPLVIRRVASGTEVELDCCDEGVWYCELVRNRMVRKESGKRPRQLKGPGDTTKALVDSLNEYKAQLFVTSGHATERDWQIGYRYRNGQFRCGDGKLFGLDTQGKRHRINSPNPKVYLPVGNCLMGHVNGRDCMALAWMNSAGVCQMIGYTLPTWYGYGGWGLLDYFVEQPGRFSLAEAFHANQQALVHRLVTNFPETVHVVDGTARGALGAVTLSKEAKAAGLTAHDARGLLFDRDAVAFHGDPGWQATMAPGPLGWKQKLDVKEDIYRFDIVPNRGEKTFDPINTNGSQRGGRPIFQFLPHRVKEVTILEGSGLHPLVTDNFLLIPNPGKCDPRRIYRVVFRAKRIGQGD